MRNQISSFIQDTKHSQQHCKFDNLELSHLNADESPVFSTKYSFNKPC